MDQESPFYDKSVDRTPYQAGWIVAGITVVFFFVGAIGLWNLASYVKHHGYFSLDHFQTGTSDDLVRQVDEALHTSIHSAAQQKIDALRQAAEQQAKDTAQQEATKQVQTQVNQLKGQ